MRLCVVGAGAIGGIIGARLAVAGETVTLVIRNAAARAAIARDGLRLIEPDKTERILRDLRVAATPEEAGPQDAVFLAVKAHQIAALVPGIRALFGAETSVVTLQNGLPWWYFQGLGGPHDGLRIEALDPGGRIAAAIEPRRIVGGVVYLAGNVPAPGVIRHTANSRLVIGAPDSSGAARVGALAARLRAAGFETIESADIRQELWLKLWSNMCVNALGALTHRPIGGVLGYPPTRALVVAMMGEAERIMAALGVRMAVTVEARLAIAERIGSHKASMLQDVEAGRTLEIDALLGAVSELGRVTGVPTPHVDAVYACAKLLDRVIAEERVAIVPKPL